MICHTKVQSYAFMCASPVYQLTKLTKSLVYVKKSQCYQLNYLTLHWS